MNVLDIILCIPMGYLIYKGYRRGIIFEVASLLGIILGCYAAIHFSKWVASLIPIQGDGALLAAFFITFIGVVILSRFVGKCAEGILKLVHVGLMNQLLGAVLGLLKAVCILAVFINFLLIIDHDQAILTPKVQSKSIFYKPVHSVGNKLTSTLKVYATQLKEQKIDKDE